MIFSDIDPIIEQTAVSLRFLNDQIFEPGKIDVWDNPAMKHKSPQSEIYPPKKVGSNKNCPAKPFRVMIIAKIFSPLFPIRLPIAVLFLA
jgi:hypothetical protein